MKKTFYYIIILIIFFQITKEKSEAQSTAGANAEYETLYIVDMPTAGVIPKSFFDINSSVYSGGGFLAELIFSPFNQFMVGISYSVTNLISDEELVFQNYPGVQVRWRIINEQLAFPAIAIGINTQGVGDFNKNEKRYQIQSPGAFISLSKSYKWALGNSALHGGINYSFEPKDKAVNFYVGFEQSIHTYASLNVEFNATLDDNENLYLSKKGMLNASLRIPITSGFTFEFQFKDLLIHFKDSKNITRNIHFEFIKRI
ncbi:MAG TPA: hypothetical protein PKY56_00570 [Candidatus Kapabacteria bacterium]|nr:hypothetical protein [Candidatus Kapabacteria bacterium]HPO61560.1 hypothetical protein [Candidatus Kapabacteria bacterium]